MGALTVLDTHFIFLVASLEKLFFLFWSSGENICLLKNTHTVKIKGCLIGFWQNTAWEPSLQHHFRCSLDPSALMFLKWRKLSQQNLMHCCEFWKPAKHWKASVLLLFFPNWSESISEILLLDSTAHLPRKQMKEIQHKRTKHIFLYIEFIRFYQKNTLGKSISLSYLGALVYPDDFTLEWKTRGCSFSPPLWNKNETLDSPKTKNLYWHGEYVFHLN